uniref:Class V myosin (Myo4), putative n=1 Tax=Ganoderma boninense TaxID=34458 RepID=A0A5K1JYX6_9APHY|nr:Class V myosin (Myo4), putative [Ganoderma boninense]
MEPVKQAEHKSEVESALVPRARAGSIANAVTVAALEVTSSLAAMTMDVSSEATTIAKGPGFEAGIPGTAFVLVNARYPGQALTIDMLDRRSVVGYPTQFGQNQQWEFIPSGAGFAIRSMLPVPAGAKKLYLSVGDWCNCDDVPVVVSLYPVAWEVEGFNKGIRIRWPNSDVAFELEEDCDGDGPMGNKVALTPTVPSKISQLWRYQRVTTIQECK